MAEEVVDQPVKTQAEIDAAALLDAQGFASKGKVEKPADPPADPPAGKDKTDLKPGDEGYVDPKSKDEENDLDIDLDVLDAPATGKKKIPATKFKELDDDFGVEEDLELDETTANLLDKVLTRAGEYKKKGNEYKVVAESEEVIKADEKIKTYSALYKLDDEKLATAIWKSKYQRAGKSAEEAETLAIAKIAEIKADAPKQIATIAEDARLDLQAAANTRISEIRNNISETKKALTLSNAPDPKLIQKTVESLTKLESFAGLKVGSKTDKAKMKAHLKPVEATIKDGSLMKRLQEDPDFLAEVAYLAIYKKQIEAAVKARKPDKKKALEQLSDAPHSGGPAPIRKPLEAAEKKGPFKDEAEAKGFK